MTKPTAPKLLAFHKAANMFPLMKGTEFTALVDDIKRRDLQNPITVIRPGGSVPVDEETIIDGRNRYRACLQAKVTPRFVPFEGKAEDIIPYIVSANIRRRHLKAAEKRKLIADLIKMMPEKSDRQIAATLDASPTTVGTVRAEMEKTGDVSKLDTRTDTKGRSQPATKKANGQSQPAKKKANGASAPAVDAAPAADEAPTSSPPSTPPVMEAASHTIDEMQSSRARVEEPDSVNESTLLTDACGALLICFERLRAPEAEIKASLSTNLYAELRRQFPLKRKRASESNSEAAR
jgi:ParB-like chromosome segregation protein Spo0J